MAALDCVSGVLLPFAGSGSAVWTQWERSMQALKKISTEKLILATTSFIIARTLSYWNYLGKCSKINTLSVIQILQKDITENYIFI